MLGKEEVAALCLVGFGVAAGTEHTEIWGRQQQEICHLSIALGFASLTETSHYELFLDYLVS